jgi:hypothetical protein
MYEGIAYAARRSDSDDFTTPDGSAVGMEQVDAYLADAAGRALRGDDPPGLSWRGVAVTFYPVDEQTVQMRLSADDVIHVRIPVPRLDQRPGRPYPPGDPRHDRHRAQPGGTPDRRRQRIADRIGTPPERPGWATSVAANLVSVVRPAAGPPSGVPPSTTMQADQWTRANVGRQARNHRRHPATTVKGGTRPVWPRRIAAEPCLLEPIALVARRPVWDRRRSPSVHPSDATPAAAGVARCHFAHDRRHRSVTE